jgi:hypothetical protein
VFFIAVWIFGGVVGEEFSSQKFIMRRFHYWQLPIVRVQIWPVRLSRITGASDDLAKHIRANRLNGDVSLEPARWDIITMKEVGQAPFRGDASILTNYLQQPGAAGMESWLKWSTDNPELAAELWLLVARLAHENLYAALPSLLEVARGVDQKDFVTEIRKMAAQECRTFATAEKEVGDADRAAALAKLAREIEAGELSPELHDEVNDTTENEAEEEPEEDSLPY